jgi:ABC-type multidrug transport system ATPase subunit
MGARAVTATHAPVELSAPPAVRAAGLRKAFGYREALKGVDLEIPASGCFVVFGPNGAGKSTLLRIISTRMRPSAGSLEVLGLDAMRSGDRVRAGMGVVFHDTFLRSDLTLEENLLFYGQLYGLRTAACRERADALAIRFGLGARRFDPVRTFSQGMAKRAALIRSLLHDPRLWLLDEPFSGLDPAGCALLEEVIAEERSGGRTIIMVTHDVEIGLRLCDDGVAVVDGTIQARGRNALLDYVRSARAAGPAGSVGG